MLSVASLHIHPVKSLGGFAVQGAKLTDRGFEHDRRWMLVDADARFITQRECSALTCMHCAPLTDGFRVTDVRDGSVTEVPWSLASGAASRASVFSDTVDVLHAPVEVSAWFADQLGIVCSLAYMPDASVRPTDPAYVNARTSLSDGYPYLIVSQASVDDLNARLNPSERIAMDRFRPNIVVAGGEAYQEDGWRAVMIGGTRFSLVKPCGRCIITTTDQTTGERGKEPLRTLASYRSVGNKVLFGMNAVAPDQGIVRVGDLVHPQA
ncbi:MAG: MOSC domain-containing protein [Flavobacteriales bacterium]|nr:MAG: MOSC domain-containing protein [Flavobacteriales bacterium]